MHKEAAMDGRMLAGDVMLMLLFAKRDITLSSTRLLIIIIKRLLLNSIHPLEHAPRNFKFPVTRVIGTQGYTPRTCPKLEGSTPL
eukprot:5011493-Pyramimonas_sp.AAC.1